MAATRLITLASALIVSLSALASALPPQGAGRGRIEPVRDAALEVQAKHNLDVAKWYYEKRKALAGAADRLQEIIDTYPEFSRMDEVLFYLGEVQMKMVKESDAIENFNKLLKDFPDSQFAKKARTRLDELQGKSK
jgi:outer membrane protein assembly factor BamD (BamD/ComL family)